ncbi:MAG: SBBP repeat-containing protein [Chloroflexota bacterium]
MLAPMGASRHPETRAAEPLSEHVNYFIGRDPAAWRTDIPTYASVMFRDVYRDIDLRWSTSSGHLEYAFEIHPGGNASVIAVRLVGSDRAFPRFFHQGAPLAYQTSGGTRRPIVSSTQLNGSTLRFRLGRYIPSRTIVVNPVLLYSSRLGGSTFDTANGIAVDTIGSAFVTGTTDSVDFPTSHALRKRRGGGACNSRPCTDVFIAKVNPQGTALEYSTYLGGNDADAGQRIAVDAQGNAYVSGITSSADFPTANPLQPSIRGTACQLESATGQFCADGFLAKVSPAGDRLIFSTYLGGSKTDWVTGMGLDSRGNVALAGTTDSPDFPMVQAVQSSLAGRHDIFVSKIAADGSHFIYSTYLGGTGEETSGEVAMDAKGNAYVAGTTQSADFPLKGGLGLRFVGANDVLLAKLSPTGKLVYSLLLGAGNSYFPVGVAVDARHSAYVTTGVVPGTFVFTKTFVGRSSGPSCPRTCEDVAVVKLSPGGDRRMYSARISGSHQDWASTIAVDSAGDAYVGGSTRSDNFPLARPIQTHRAGERCQIEGGAPCSDGLLMELDPRGTRLLFSTYFGGESEDNVLGIALGRQDTLYFCGYTQSAHFPVKRQFAGNHDEESDGGFVAAIRLGGARGDAA